MPPSLAGGILAAYLLWIAVRGGGMTGGSRLGWPTDALLAGAAFVVGLGTPGLGAPALGPVEAQAAGFALAALAVVPVATGRDVLRIGIGLFLLLQAALLVGVGLDGYPSQLEQVVSATLVAALGGAVAALGYAARSDGPGGFDLATECAVPHPPTARRATRFAAPAGGDDRGRGTMSLIPFLLISIAVTGAALILRGRPTIATSVVLAGLVASLIAALAIRPGETIVIGGATVATTDFLRLFLVLGCLSGLVLALLGAGAGTRRDAPAVMLGTLAAAALALSLPDARIAVPAATIGGLLGVLVTLVPTGARVGATVGIREVRAVIIAGALAIGAAAWIARPLGDLAVEPQVFGLAYLCFAIAVAIRFGVIPFHFWAARLADAAPEVTLPVLTAWGPAVAGGGGPRMDRRRRCTGPPGGRCRTRGPDRDRRRDDRARDVRRMDPGRPRARPRLFDHGRCRRHHPRARGARDRGMDPGPRLDPRIRRGAQRLRRVVCRDPGDVLDRPARRPARLGAALAAPRPRRWCS